ncbi:MAG TPA: HD domain-containing phosphohydrolase [Pyrinomonadaceae bacterium]|jgi:response regulator RpfG family c-di-GMP phosphodiesterase
MFDLAETEKNLLLVDENSKMANLLSRLLRSNYICDRVETSEAALWKLKQKEYCVVLCDASLLKSESLQIIPQMQMLAPHASVLILGEKNSAENVIKAFRAGAFDYLFKPLEFEQVETAITRAIEQHEVKCLKDRYQFHLETLAAERATEIDRVLEEVESSYRITLKALVQALETRDFETHGHSERVVTFSLRLGYELGLEKGALRDLELGALLHDIGKIGVPDAILRKPAKLNEEEWVKMKLHPLHGQKILRNIKFLESAARVVAQHHERWDGEGYPNGIRGEDIDIGARIFAVVDAFDAMISDRVYRKGRSYEEALKELELFAGTQFDPLVVEAFKAIPKEDWEILRERSLMEKQEVSSFQSVVAELVYSRQQFEMVH